jgi:hypothetical protein
MMKRTLFSASAAALALGFVGSAPAGPRRAEVPVPRRLGLLWAAAIQRAVAEHLGRAWHLWRLDATAADVPPRRRLATVPGICAAAMIGGL